MADLKVEDVKPANFNSEETQARFAHLCKKELALDYETFAKAMEIFLRCKEAMLTSMFVIEGTSRPEEAERCWFAFILFAVKRLRRPSLAKQAEGADQNKHNLCSILRPLKLNLVNFFKVLPQFSLKFGPVLSSIYGLDWEKRLESKELQENLDNLIILSKQYKLSYYTFFKASDADEDSSIGSSGHASDYHRFGWLLFLALHVHASDRSKEPVPCTSGLVSILAILIIHVPKRFRNAIVDEPHFFVKKTQKGVDLLGSLCSKYGSTEDEVKRMMGKANDFIVDILKKKPYLASECKRESLQNIDPDGLIYFEDLLGDTSLLSNMNMLEKDYDCAICSKGSIDGRVFLEDKDNLIGSGSLSDEVVNMSGSKRKFNGISSPASTMTCPISPCRPPKIRANGGSIASLRNPATPVSTALTTAQWLHTVISSLPPKPSADLERFLSSCDKDVANDVLRRAHIILEAIFPNSVLGEQRTTASLPNANLMDSIWAHQRRMEALKLYYRVLEAMCTAEAQLLHANNLTSLLTNERFHRCMLACSAELILATHKTATMLFPAVLEKTGITAFDLSKVIESFIRHEETLPRELRRHLNSLEERLLESMVWEKGSSMYNSLIITRPSLSVEINQLGLLAEPMPSLDEIYMRTHVHSGGLPVLQVPQNLETLSGQNGCIRSPKKACTEYRSVLVERNSFTPPRLLSFNNLKAKLTPPPLQSAFASPNRPNPVRAGETCADSGINIFFRKIVKLAAVRINGMVERLQLSQQLRETVYRLFQQTLIQKTQLFFNRHIDQIILCCLYTAAKISQLRLTFREISYNYGKQPQCKPQVLQSVFVDWTSAPNHRRRTGQGHVTIIQFYNEVFVPSVKNLVAELDPLGSTEKANCVPDANRSNDVQCPGSPTISAFPNVPDMSPKKVSTMRNIYVSPLRSAKMDVLISHNSKSYYACVGESTHAYQSPSKDLNAINDRLNRAKRELDYKMDDGSLISDSFVERSLCLQNGSALSAAATVKTERPDC